MMAELFFSAQPAGRTRPNAWRAPKAPKKGLAELSSWRAKILGNHLGCPESGKTVPCGGRVSKAPCAIRRKARRESKRTKMHFAFPPLHQGSYQNRRCRHTSCYGIKPFLEQALTPAKTSRTSRRHYSQNSQVFDSEERNVTLLFNTTARTIRNTEIG